MTPTEEQIDRAAAAIERAARAMRSARISLIPRQRYAVADAYNPDGNSYGIQRLELRDAARIALETLDNEEA